jgi:hypothetical protein
VLAGSVTPENRERVESFYFSVASIFEAWVARRRSEHTRRAYRGDVMAFSVRVAFMIVAEQFGQGLSMDSSPAYTWDLRDGHSIEMPQV